MDSTMLIVVLTAVTYHSGTEIRGSPLPPAELIVDISETVLKTKDIVLIRYEQNDLALESLMVHLYKLNAHATVFQFTGENWDVDLYHKMLQVISNQRTITAVFLLDSNSTAFFIRHGVIMEKVLRFPCYYYWVAFEVNERERTLLKFSNLSTICWHFMEVVEDNSPNSPVNDMIILEPYISINSTCVPGKFFAKWNPSKRIYSMQKPEEGFGNRLFKIAITNEQPFFAKKKNGGYEGIEYQLLKTLSQMLNFRYEIINKTDNAWGSLLPNGSWTGYMRMVAEKVVIFSVATLSITEKRIRSVDFTSPYLYDRLTFAVLTPDLATRAFVLVKPFAPQVWIALLATLVTCTFILYAITYMLPAKSGVRRAYNIWFLLRTFGQQGTTSPAPARYSIRFFVSAWWMFIMVILWSYAGTLTSYMTYPGHQKTVDTIPALEKALKDETFSYGTIGGTTYSDFFMNTLRKSHPIYAEYLKEHPEDLTTSVESGLYRVLDNPYAFVYMKLALKWHAAQIGYEKFRISRDVFNMEALGIAIQKCHPCKNRMNHVIDRLEETGFFSKWYDDAFIHARIRAPKPLPENPVRPLAISDVQGALYLLVIGYCIGTWSFFTEAGFVIIRKKISKKTRKIKKRKRTNLVKDVPIYFRVI